MFKKILSRIIGFDMTIEIIGSWIWCFDRYEYKEQLKELKFRWVPKKKSWVWHYGEYRKIYNKEVTLDEIRNKYGSQQVSYKSECYLLN